MRSLVEELQADALNSAVDIGDLLRKAFAVAAKLKLAKFRQWCEFELNGYPENQELPPHRLIRGTLRSWNPYNGAWIPMIFYYDSQLQDRLSLMNYRAPVAAVQDLLNNPGDGRFHVTLPPETQVRLMEGTDSDFETSLHIGRGSLVKLIDTVRNTILDWSLRLESDSILGEGMSFNSQEKEKAVERSTELQSIVNYITVGTMTNSTIQQSSPKASHRAKSAK